MGFTNYQIILVDATMIMGLLILVAVVQGLALEIIESPDLFLNYSLANNISLIIPFALSAFISALHESRNNFQDKIVSKLGFRIMCAGFGYIVLSFLSQFIANFLLFFV